MPAGTRRIIKIVAIEGFKSKALKRLARKGDGRGLPPASLRRIAAIPDTLDGLNPMKTLSLRTYRMHPLKGDRKGYWGVTVTGNWRITFRYDGEHAYDVDLVDYH